MPTPNADPESSLQRLQLLLYLVPVFGCVPAVWSLYIQPGSKQVQSVSRLVVTMAVGWILLYGLLSAGSQLSPSFTLRLMTTNLLVTTGYFLTNLWLMVRLLRGQSVRLPGISQLSRRIP
ncbi:hypothetical protein C7271_09285 [filamentous cyanobacterium CCP5]|nr:hypothetical protein C7271_09285 [filamentous cyanobacterium CCP5]